MDRVVAVRYALSGDARLAFTVRGRGAYRIVAVLPWIGNQDLDTDPDAITERLWSIGTVVSYDQRGSGLSDPVVLDDLPTLERWTDDLHAVIDAAGVEHAVLYTGAISGPIAMLYAASHPERTRALILLNTQAALAWSEDYPAGVKPEVYERWIAWVQREWGTGRLTEALSGRSFDETQLRAAARFERTLPPAAVGPILRQQYHTDVRAILPAISAPTLVLHTVDNPWIPVARGEYLAEHIPDARLVALPGSDNAVFSAETAQRCADEIEEFLTGTRGAASYDRMLTTLLLTDLVGSTDRAASVGDQVWRNLLDHHDAAVRRQLERFSGRENKYTGDGVLATFDGPARAIRCGSAIRDAARQLGLDVRVGIHTGEVELRDTELAGIAVHLARRVCDAAQASQILVTRTVVDLVAGSGIAFEDRGTHNLKGIPAPWQLFSVAT